MGGGNPISQMRKGSSDRWSVESVESGLKLRLDSKSSSLSTMPCSPVPRCRRSLLLSGYSDR